LLHPNGKASSYQADRHLQIQVLHMSIFPAHQLSFVIKPNHTTLGLTNDCVVAVELLCQFARCH